MTLTLHDIAQSPHAFVYPIKLTSGEQGCLRPLEPGDANRLAQFLEGLSPRTRRLSTFEGYDLSAAESMCDAINKYDKLRFVLEFKHQVVGLIEFSFGLPKSDIARYKEAEINLDEKTDLRVGPTLADDYQGKGLGSSVFPLITNLARQFGKNRLILWGGVLKENERAIKYYKMHGFQEVGGFSSKGDEKLDMMLDLEAKTS